VCHLVRAPGVKWTCEAAAREGLEGVATVSMKTVPVNQSAGPRAVPAALRVICMSILRRSGSARLGAYLTAAEA
jgi:hypothetical protein